MESIDDLLAQVKAEVEGKKPASPQKRSAAASIGDQEEKLLAELKAEFIAQDQEAAARAAEQLRQAAAKQEAEQRQAQLREQQKQERKRQALAKDATEWLKRLNPRSDEGIWFEEFAYNYPSRLEAAIDYLAALKETKAYP